jgi:hypothetical protein
MHYDNSFFLLNIGQRAALLRYRIAVLPQCAPRANKTDAGNGSYGLCRVT